MKERIKFLKTKGCLKIELKIWNQLLMNFVEINENRPLNIPALVESNEENIVMAKKTKSRYRRS